MMTTNRRSVNARLRKLEEQQRRELEKRFVEEFARVLESLKAPRTDDPETLRWQLMWVETFERSPAGLPPEWLAEVLERFGPYREYPTPPAECA